MRGTRTLAQLRHQDDAAPHFAGVEVAAQALDGDLSLILVAVRPAEDGHAWGLVGASAIDDRQGHQRVAPAAIEVKCRLIVVRARAGEIDRVGIDAQGSHSPR